MPCWRTRSTRGGAKAEVAKSLYGTVAISSAKAAYQIYKEVFDGEPFRGPGPRRRADRSVCSGPAPAPRTRAFSDVKYIESVIGPDTVNTVPVETLDAYRDHGKPEARLEQDLDEMRRVLERLPDLGIDIDQVTRRLEDEGVEKFNKPFDKLLETLAARRAAA